MRDYDDFVKWFKQVIRKKVPLRCLTAICSGDEMMGRSVAVKGLRE